MMDSKVTNFGVSVTKGHQDLFPSRSLPRQNVGTGASERTGLAHARHAGGFFYELVKYVTRSLQSPFDDPNLAAFSKESDKEGASIDFRSGRLEKNKGI